MLKLKSLTLKNFLSVGNVTQAVRLDDHGLTLVLGNNSDSNGGITKNGAGKTALLQAVSFALYGEPLTRIKIDNLINNINQRGMLVTLDFEMDGKDYRIERGRKPNVMKFFVNGEEIEDDSKGENRETQHDIVSLVGMTHTMFTHIVALNTYTEPFLKLKAAQQREVSEELLGVTQISTRAETLKKLINETKTSITQEEADIRAAQGVNARITTEITDVSRRKEKWDTDHAASVAELARQIEELSVIDFDKEKNLFDELDAWNNHQRDLQSRLQLLLNDHRNIEAEAARLKRDLAALETNDPTTGLRNTRQRLIKDIERKQSEITKLEAEAKRLGEEIDALQTKIDNPGDHTCVTCAQPLEGTDHLTKVMTNLDAEMKRVVVRYTEVLAYADAIREDITAMEAEIHTSTTTESDLLAKRQADMLDLSERIAEVDKRVIAEKQAITNAKDQMAAEEDKPLTFFETREELYSTKHLLDNCMLELERERVKENPHVSHLNSLNTTMQVVEFDEIDRLRDLLLHQDFLLSLLTKKDSFIRKKIIDQNLFYLNTRVNHYLEKLGLPHEVVFQNDLTVDITLLGRDFDFAQLSRGESNRVIMAVSWSFRDVWESLNHSVNLVWVDELMDNGLDSQGAEAALAILKSFSRNRKNVFLISHRDELVGRIDRTLMVSKDNGFTTIQEDLT